MLRELNISNLAIIENVAVEFAPGFNVVTGQTGAGKSMVIGALELLLGLRAGGAEEAAVIVRPGCDEARVSGLFEISGAEAAEQIGCITDQTIKPGEPLLITRRVFASGRTSASVNGQPATVAMLRQAGQFLIDIHGQHDQQFLLRPANQLLILDAFCRAEDARRNFAAVHRELRDLQRRKTQLEQTGRSRSEQLDLLAYQADELDKARLQAGELDKLKGRYSVIRNAGRLKEECLRASQSLDENDGSLVEQLGRISRTLGELTAMDAKHIAGPKDAVDQAMAILQDAARDLRGYGEGLDVEPGELEKLEERLDLLNRLVHKYVQSSRQSGAVGQADPVGQLLEFRKQIGEKIAQLSGDSTALGELDGRIDDLGKKLEHIGPALSRTRRKGAERIKSLVEEQFKQLGMDGSAFDASIKTLSADDPAVGPSGLDEIEFLVRTNPGMDALPLAKIASGGELSRIMLALKTILADNDRISILVFDEIDANIGDRLGEVIGRKLQELAHAGPSAGRTKQPARQVICITHLSQIAARADHHIHVAKQVVGKGEKKQTVMQVRAIAGDDRVREIAEMLAGKNVTDAVLQHARQMLEMDEK
ncbi:MAG: DNA repair protein RecN [Planctomycetes bacterium]|nr:DNA repair protein RecN [Planctomycetota bacterium]